MSTIGNVNGHTYLPQHQATLDKYGELANRDEKDNRRFSLEALSASKVVNKEPTAQEVQDVRKVITELMAKLTEASIVDEVTYRQKGLINYLVKDGKEQNNPTQAIADEFSTLSKINQLLKPAIVALKDYAKTEKEGHTDESTAQYLTEAMDGIKKMLPIKLLQNTTISSVVEYDIRIERVALHKKGMSGRDAASLIKPIAIGLIGTVASMAISAPLSVVIGAASAGNVALKAKANAERRNLDDVGEDRIKRGMVKEVKDLYKPISKLLDLGEHFADLLEEGEESVVDIESKDFSMLTDMALYCAQQCILAGVFYANLIEAITVGASQMSQEGLDDNGSLTNATLARIVTEGPIHISEFADQTHIEPLIASGHIVNTVVRGASDYLVATELGASTYASLQGQGPQGAREAVLEANPQTAAANSQGVDNPQTPVGDQPAGFVVDDNQYSQEDNSHVEPNELEKGALDKLEMLFEDSQVNAYAQEGFSMTVDGTTPSAMLSGITPALSYLLKSANKLNDANADFSQTVSQLRIINYMVRDQKTIEGLLSELKKEQALLNKLGDVVVKANELFADAQVDDYDEEDKVAKKVKELFKTISSEKFLMNTSLAVKGEQIQPVTDALYSGRELKTGERVVIAGTTIAASISVGSMFFGPIGAIIGFVFSNRLARSAINRVSQYFRKERAGAGVSFSETNRAFKDAVQIAVSTHSEAMRRRSKFGSGSMRKLASQDFKTQVSNLRTLERVYVRQVAYMVLFMANVLERVKATPMSTESLSQEGFIQDVIDLFGKKEQIDVSVRQRVADYSKLATQIEKTLMNKDWVEKNHRPKSVSLGKSNSKALSLDNAYVGPAKAAEFTAQYFTKSLAEAERVGVEKFLGELQSKLGTLYNWNASAKPSYDEKVEALEKTVKGLKVPSPNYPKLKDDSKAPLTKTKPLTVDEIVQGATALHHLLQTIVDNADKYKDITVWTGTDFDDDSFWDDAPDDYEGGYDYDEIRTCDAADFYYHQGVPSKLLVGLDLGWYDMINTASAAATVLASNVKAEAIGVYKN